MTFRAIPIAMLAIACLDCGDAIAPASDAGRPQSDAIPSVDVPSPIATGALDLLLEIENASGSEPGQIHLIAQLPALIDSLVTPPDRDHDGRPDHPPVTSLHLAVLDADLGTQGSPVPGCIAGDVGDDGLLDPVHYGQAEMHHRPADNGAPADFRPADCGDADAYPSFIRFASTSGDPASFEHDVVCNAAIWGGGCGVTQPLEAIWRALVWPRTPGREGNVDPNAGFLRDDAVLALIVMSRREDMSVRDCRYPASGPACASDPARTVFDPASTAWSSSDLLLRSYLYRPCGPQDPMWPVTRYIDPRDPTVGFPSLKPGHPEAVVFAAITGVPLDGRGFPSGTDGRIDWDALLGTPGSGGPDDYCGRDATATGQSLDTTVAEGRISMRQANPDPDCPTVRVVPACRAAGTASTCDASAQYSAPPARRLVEIARRFDQAAWCDGAACHNGTVTSICSADYTAAFDLVAHRLVAP